MNTSRRVLFLYLGKRGSLGRFTLELARASRGIPGLEATFAISRLNENIDEFAWLGHSMLVLDTFEHALSPATISNLFVSRRKLLQRLASDHTDTVVTLMPHIWTPLLGRSIQARDVAYTTIIHDAISHPGDPTALVTPWLRSEAGFADRVVTLSRSVADQLVENGIADRAKVWPLFHPDLSYGSSGEGRTWSGRAPLRLLFMGRIFKYKGLDLLLDAIEMLRARGIAVQLGVAGAGAIDGARQRLDALGAEVINRWLDDAEIALLLERYDAMALPYIEASQSGVAAVAFGSCMPVIAMPSGGLVEQVIEGSSGVVATDVSAAAFADAIHRLATSPALFAEISGSLKRTAAHRSMHTFLECLLRDEGATPHAGESENLEGYGR